MTLVLMDVDGTLLPNPSSETRFILYLASRGKLGPVQLTAALAFYVAYGRRYGRHVGRKNKAYLHRLSRAKVAALAQRFVAQRLLPRVRPALLERVRAHQRAGDRVALLTGAPDFLAAPLAEGLGVSLWCATQCSGNDRRYGWGPPIQHPLGTDKLAAAERLCRQTGVALADAVAYADSIHDLELLQRVAQPVAVHPDRALARVARQRGWERIDATHPAPALDLPD